MKKIIVATIVFLIGLLQAKATNSTTTDTTYIYNNKVVKIDDNEGKIKVQVFDSVNNEYKQVFEGVYSDSKSFEKWTVADEWGLNLPLLNKIKKRERKRMEPHWAGIGWGFASFTDGGLSPNSAAGLSLRAEKSNEFYINPIEKIIPVIGNNLGITTGFGMHWGNYHFDNNTHLVETNSVVNVEPAPAGINYSFSRFRTFGLSVPLLLEFQTKLNTNHLIFLSAGVVGGVNTYSSYRVKYKNPNGGKVNDVESKNLNVSPLSIDYMVQIGYGSWSIFAKYAQFSIFQKDKGPVAHPVSLGATLNF